MGWVTGLPRRRVRREPDHRLRLELELERMLDPALISQAVARRAYLTAGVSAKKWPRFSKRSSEVLATTRRTDVWQKL